jgi:hypothetical protein
MSSSDRFELGLPFQYNSHYQAHDSIPERERWNAKKPNLNGDTVSTENEQDVI